MNHLLVRNHTFWSLVNTYVRLHENMTAYYVNELCRVFEIDPFKPTLAASLHDHGKMVWPPELFTKKKEELTEEDMEEIILHPIDATSVILREYPSDRRKFMSGDVSIIDLVGMHHETPDGNGYYKVKDIPIEVAIISIADRFDACYSDRCYKQAMELNVAVIEATKCFNNYLIKKGYNPDIIIKTLKESSVSVRVKITNQHFGIGV